MALPVIIILQNSLYFPWPIFFLLEFTDVLYNCTNKVCRGPYIIIVDLAYGETEALQYFSVPLFTISPPECIIGNLFFEASGNKSKQLR